MRVMKLIIEKFDFLSLFIGMFTTFMALAIQPRFSETRLLIENGMWASPFLLLSILSILPIMGILIYRDLKSRGEI